MSLELYKQHRPVAFKGIYGQPEAVRILKGMTARENGIPHAILLTGPSGCGKTTIARILRRKLEVGEADYSEVNAADFRGIDTIREIRQRIPMAAMQGKFRMWVIDEAHQLVSQAQNALLKVLEDTPPHVYLILATTDPQKLLKTIITRCTEVRLKPIATKDIEDLIVAVCEKEGKELPEAVREKIAEHADGSARKALVLLDSVLPLESEDDQLKAIESVDVKPQAIALARALISPRPQWKEVAAILKGLNGEDPEQLRHMVLGYASAVLLGGGNLAPRANLMIQAFERNFYDSKRAGLINASYEVCTH